ncbi:ADP-ribosylglycohydrolase family protein [Butyrivibrio proteoclasticus]|uniref:ADP-ribosylglycohydrolase family protein n=1 Tax=Butyrivibrio proteoclasticus TaxID=43305 RepID=UPI00047BE732|nr:ADP-ribosylglycohydrolase family protein [Butyrivibrio proteoclasticus]
MSVKGAVIGDIIGAQYEFSRPRDLDWEKCPLIEDPRFLYFTDDTVMTLAIKKAILEKADLVQTMVEIGRRYPNSGYGGQFYRWITTDDHSPYGSWGNGSAMRVSYVGEYYDDFDIMQAKAAETAAVSHNDIEGIKGAVVTATCIWMVRQGKSKEEVYRYVLDQYPSDGYKFSICRSLDEIRDEYVWSVSCMDTVPVAFRCFYESKDYESFMRNIFSLDCDSDTFGAVAGSAVEEYYGGFGNIDAEKILEDVLTADLKEILNQ